MFMKSRYNDWVENLAWDWGISRQRFYGIPFPAWHCQDCGHILLADQEQLPIDPQETPYTGPCTNCNGTNITPDTDVMDTWNTSSLTPYICADLYNNGKNSTDFIPMSMRPQAHDIIRTWAFDTIVKTWMHNTCAPWKDIVISGHVLSDKKEKLSKKDGNAMDPEVLLQKYPADAIRYWTASARLGQDLSFTEEQLVIGQKLITKLWNAFKFAEPHLVAFETLSQAPQNLGGVNEWILHTISACFAQYQHYFDQKEASLALNTIEQFFWNDYCDNYVELIKNQLFNPDQYPAEQIYATRWTLYHVGLRILQLYAPYVPHITEALYCELYAKHENIASIHQIRYQKVQNVYVFEDQSTTMRMVIALATAVRKIKTEQALSLKTELASLHVYIQTKALSDALAEHTQLIRGVTHSTEIIYKENNNNQTYLAKIEDLWHAHVVLQ